MGSNRDGIMAVGAILLVIGILLALTGIVQYENFWGETWWEIEDLGWLGIILSLFGIGLMVYGNTLKDDQQAIRYPYQQYLPPQYPPQYSAPQPQQNLLFCAFCGKQIPIDAMICPYCGKQVSRPL